MSTEVDTAKGSAPDAVRFPDGRLMSGKDAPIGGQAVLEGVMMRGVSTWAVAVRKSAEVQSPEPGSGDGAGNAALAPAAGLDGVVAASPNGAGASASNTEALGEIDVQVESFEPWIRKRRAFR